MKWLRMMLMVSVMFVSSGANLFAQTGKVTYEELKAKYVPQRSPYATVRLELDMLKQGMYCYDLPMFDADWRKRGKKIQYSSRYKHTAQKFNVPYKVYKEVNKAIVYYPNNKSEGPDFLYRAQRGWVLDRTAVWDYIHYNTSNSGWFVYEGNYPYLRMLKKIFPMERILLSGGQWAYKIKG